MEDFEDTTNMETPSDFMAEMMMDEKDGEEFTRHYLKTRFLSSVGRSLYYARRQAGLTQTQIAQRMNTTQSAIARFEADEKGSMSFRRYIDFAIACNMMPRSLVLRSILEPISSLRDEIIASFTSQSFQEPSSSQQHSDIGRSDSIRTVLSTQKASLQIDHAPLSIQDFKAAIENNQKAGSQFQHPSLAESILTTNTKQPTTTTDQPKIDNQTTINNVIKREFVYA